MLNTYYNPSVGGKRFCTLMETVPPGYIQGLASTQPGTYGPINSTDMQGAVWALTGVCRVGLAGRQAGWFGLGGGFRGTKQGNLGWRAGRQAGGLV